MAKYALLIGVSSYQNQDAIQPSLTARKDVEAVREVLLRPDIGGFAEVPKPLLDPDRMQMEEEIENFFRKLGSDDLAVLLFAGQGVRDRQGNAFLTTTSTRRNGDGELVRATALSARAVQDIMGGSRAKQQVMILDCGFGGMEPHPKAVYNGALDLKRQLGGQGRVILLGAEAAHHIPQYDSEELSPYAHLLVEGIRTGKADRNHDRQVSVDELHDYITDELKAVLVAGHPELIAWREEDRSIPLTRVPIFDPRQQYRAQVERRVQDGQISAVGRAILDKRRTTLGLQPSEAQAIEDDILRPYREREKDMQRYRQALQAAVRQEYPLPEQARQELREFQQLLELSDEEVEPIQQEVIQPYADRAATLRQHRQQYEQAFRDTIAQHFPPTPADRYKLRQMQRSLDLSEDDVQAIEARISSAEQTQREQYHQTLRQFEQTWQKEMRASFPPTDVVHHRMQKLQHSLGVQESHAREIFQRVRSQIEAERATHQANCAKYEQAFLDAVKQDGPLRKPTRDRLAQLQQALNLSDTDVVAAEDRASETLRQERERYRQNLAYYRQQCEQLLQEEFPLSEANQNQLKRLQTELQLQDDDVAQIHEQLMAQAEVQRRAYQQALKQYEITYREALDHGNPAAAETRHFLDETWRALNLKADEVRRLEDRLNVEHALQTPEAPSEVAADPAAAAPAETPEALAEPVVATAEPADSAPAPTDSPVPPPPENLTGEPSEHPEPVPEARFFDQLSEADQAKIDAEVDDLHALLERGDMDEVLKKIAAPPPPEEPFSEPYAPPPNAPSNSGAPPSNNGGGSFVPGYVPPPPSSSSDSDDLASDRNVDYTILQGLLQDGLWKEADRETLRVMLMATDRIKDEWLSPEAIANFPCLDLQTISQLWDKHSNGHFGFIAQEHIYAQFREIKMSDDRRLIDVSLRLKWMWKAANFYPMFRKYKDLDFNSDTAVTGHLPALWYWKLSPVAALRTGTVGSDRSYGGTDIKMLANLMKRLRECNIY